MTVKLKRAPAAPSAPRAAGQAAGAVIAGAKPVTPNPGRPVTPPGGQATGVNQNPGSRQYGQTYAIQPTTGGVFHVYQNGQKIFVPAAAAPASSSAASQAAAAADPKDSQYYADTAQDTFDRNAKLNDINTTGARDRTDTAEAIRRALENQPRALDNAKANANKQGLFFSGKLGQDLGDINTQYQRQHDDMQADLDRREADRQTAISAIQGGSSLEEVQRLLQAGDRQTARDTTAADAGTLANENSPSAAAAPGTKINPKTGLAYTTITIGGKTFHLYADGRKVRVSGKK